MASLEAGTKFCDAAERLTIVPRWRLWQSSSLPSSSRVQVASGIVLPVKVSGAGGVVAGRTQIILCDVHLQLAISSTGYFGADINALSMSICRL